MWSRTSRELIEWYPSVNSISHFSSIVLILFIYLFFNFSFCWKKENDSTKWHRCSDRTENLDDDGRFGQLWQSGECDKNGGLEEIKGNVRCGYCIWRRTVRSLWLVQLGYSPGEGSDWSDISLINICTAERLQRKSLVSCVGWTGFWHIGHVARNWSELDMHVEQNTWPHGDAII